MDNLHHVLININVITRVTININIEKILSYIKLPSTVSQVQIKHFGVICSGVITAEIQTIQRILNMSEPITFHTHISYFFLIIAAKVVAISGKLVHAAIIVAQIAHSDIHSAWAINIAVSTIISDAIINNHILATSFVTFNNIHLEVSLAHGILLLNTIIINNNNNIAIKISLILSIQKTNLKVHPLVSMFMNAKRSTQIKRYTKFLIFGTETSIASSPGDSFFIIKYQIYQHNKPSNVVHSRTATCWSRRIIKIKAVIQSKNIQSL